jgi:predicted nucleotidyltransferase component of viral defense system
MNLHQHKEEFRTLQVKTAKWVGIPEMAIEKDYFIVLVLQNLEKSQFSEKCVFKGGTSLSKCYPGSIERFSEDIDLTYVPEENEGDNQIEKGLKAIEESMARGFKLEKVPQDRNKRNKSSFIHFPEMNQKIKLEIGSIVLPSPIKKMSLKTYIQEYLESTGDPTRGIEEFGLEQVVLNVLDISRTFMDKVMAVKRHAIVGTINTKVRHIYDVKRLFERKEIKTFLTNEKLFKQTVQDVKKTDSHYLGARGVSQNYDPFESYSFEKWESRFDKAIRRQYEELHLNLLYTKTKQSFDEAITVFREISRLLTKIGE